MPVTFFFYVKLTSALSDRTRVKMVGILKLVLIKGVIYSNSETFVNNVIKSLSFLLCASEADMSYVSMLAV